MLDKNKNQKLPLMARNLIHGAGNALLSAFNVEIKNPKEPKWLVLEGIENHITSTYFEDQRLGLVEVQKRFPGSTFKTGWMIADIRRKGMEKFFLTMKACTMLVLADETFVSPFADTNSIDYFIPMELTDTDGGYNEACYANYTMKGQIGVLHQFKLTWIANCGKSLALSMDMKHSQFQSWHKGNGADYLRKRGLDPFNKLDVYMCTDFDEFIEAMAFKPTPSEMSEAQFKIIMESVELMYKKDMLRDKPQTEPTSVPEGQVA